MRADAEFLLRFFRCGQPLHEVGLGEVEEATVRVATAILAQPVFVLSDFLGRPSPPWTWPGTRDSAEPARRRFANRSGRVTT